MSDAMVTLHYHPFSRAAGVVWMLEEVGVDYELRFVNLMKGEHKTPAALALNPMGKIPIVEDDGGDGERVVVTEAGAIGLYLADRYALGTLAPAPDDPRRGPYLRWAFFAPSVIEPGLMAKANDWTFKETQAGWGNHAALLDAMEAAVAGGDYLLGDSFSMADVIFGGTTAFMLQFGMLEKRDALVAYVERLKQRPAHQRAEAKNAAMRREHGLETPG